MNASEKERLSDSMNGNFSNGELPKTEGSKKSGIRWIYLVLSAIGIAVVAALIGGMVGYNMKPVAKTDDLVVTEDVSGPVEDKNASAENGEPVTSLKPYTQITSIMDNARHVVEERYYAADGSIVACEDGYGIMRKKYDDNGNMVSTSYFDTADQPFFVEKLGYSSYAIEGIIRVNIPGMIKNLN